MGTLYTGAALFFAYGWLTAVDRRDWRTPEGVDWPVASTDAIQNGTIRKRELSHLPGQGTVPR